MVPIALTVAGSDPSGGAGLQADLKTFHRHGVYGAAVVSLVTVQNTLGVQASQALSPELVRGQLEAVLDDLAPRALKTGALGSAPLVEAVAACLEHHELPLVVDPVRISKHGASLLDDDARGALLSRLLPLATLITPNAHEAGWLTGSQVEDEASALRAARELVERGARAVLLKGGHLTGAQATDYLCTPGSVQRLVAPRSAVRHTHGLGCTLSAAITAWLARGLPLSEACVRAKRWLSLALESAPGVGHGIGPVNHLQPLPEP